MSHELEVEDILIPQRKRKHKHVRRKAKRKAGGFTKFCMLLVLVIIVLGVILSFADIGGNIILDYAEKYLSDNYNISLTAERITGNPVKGYTLHNFEIGENGKQSILSAGFLSGRVNFPALITGRVRLAEISLGKLSTDIDKLIDTAKNFTLPVKTPEVSRNFVTASPAYADDNNSSMPEIPLDYFSLSDGDFSSQYGQFHVNKINADLNNFDVEIDGDINGIKLTGDIDLGESAGLTAVNRSDINFGSGKILATGGLINDKLDFHASIDGLDLNEMTALYPELLHSKDFNGNANLNIDVTGEITNPKVTGALDYKGTKIYGYPVERASTSFNYSDYRIGLNNIQANILNVPIQGELAAANRPGEDISVMIKLDGSEANLSGLDKVLNIPELKPLSGKVSSFNANISGTVKSLSGLVTFSAPKIAYGDRAVTNIRAQMRVNKSDTAHVDGKFNFEGANGYIQGSVASMLINPDFNVSAKIADLDIKRVENMIPDASEYKLAGKITAEVTLKGTMSNPNVTGYINSPEFSGFDQKITKPVINFAFADKILTISKTEGTLNGMPINLSGTVGPLPSTNPNLNVNATIAMTPAALKEYVPDIDSYALKGTVNAGVKVQGSVNSPAIKFLASSAKLEAMNMIKASDIELTTDINGDLTKLENIDINAAAKSITAAGVTFSNVNSVLSKRDDEIRLGGFNAKSGSGTITGTGVASVSGKKPLDFNFKFMNLDLASLASASGVDVKGNLSGALKISGSNTNPAVNLSANIPALEAVGVTLTNIIANLSGNMTSIKLDKVRAEVEGAEILALGNIQIQPALKFNVAINGNNIKLERLMRLTSPDMKEDPVKGAVAFNFNLSGNEKNITGSGKLSSSTLKAYGLNLTNVHLPLAYSYPSNIFTSNNGTAKLYGGTAKNNLTFNINTMKFTDNLEASGISVNPLIQDTSGGLEGKITGTGKLTMKIEGAIGETVTYSGTGNFSMGEGAITGFTWVDLIARLHGTTGLKYTSVNAPLTLQTGKLILRAGTIANAPKNDPMFSYAKLARNSTIDFSGDKTKLDLYVEGNVNYQLINALMGGSKGGLDSVLKLGTVDVKSGMKALLSGGLKEAAKSAKTRDFRNISLRIHGPAEKLSYSSIKIGESTTIKAASATSSDVEALKKRAVETAVKTIDSKLPESVKSEVKKILPANTKTPTTRKEVKAVVKQAETKAKDTVKKKVETAVKNNKTKVKEELKKGLGRLFK